MIYKNAIPTSFGMDFVDIYVNPELSGQPLQLTLQSHGARLNVEIWRLESGLWERPRALTPQPESTLEREEGLHTYSIPHLDPEKHQQFTMVITRLDSSEKSDPYGSYTITIEGTPGTSDDNSTVGFR